MSVTCEFLCKEQLKQYVVFILKPSKLTRTNKVSKDLYLFAPSKDHSASILLFVANIQVFTQCIPLINTYVVMCCKNRSISYLLVSLTFTTTIYLTFYFILVP